MRYVDALSRLCRCRAGEARLWRRSLDGPDRGFWCGSDHASFHARTTELGSATAVQRNSGRAAKRETHCGPHAPLPEQPDLTWSSHSLVHAMPCSIRAQARSLTMGRHAAPLAQRQRDVALELAVASDRALDKLLLAFEPRCRVPSAGATRFAVLGPHPRRSQLLLPPGSCSAPHDQP